MKDLYEEFFEVPEEGAVAEKVVLSRAVMTLVSVLLILGVLAVTAYAYFGVYATSPSISVAAAHFKAELSVSVTDDQGTVQLLSGEIATRHTVTLQAGKTYSLTLKPAGNAQGGFCVLSASNCDETYYTQQLGADAAVSGGKTPKIVFTVIPTGDTVLTIDASWGTSSFYGRVDKSDERYVFGSESVTMTIAGAQLPVVEEEKETTETTPTETQPVQPQTEPTQPERTQPEETQTQESQPEPTQPAETTVETTTATE